MLEQDPKKTRSSGEGGRHKKDSGKEARTTPKKAAAKRAASTSTQPPKKRVARKKEGEVETPRAEAVTMEERHRMIAEAAYYIAERRGFQGGDPEQDWREAEAQISGMLHASSEVGTRA